MGFVENVEGELFAVDTGTEEEDDQLILLWIQQHGAVGPQKLAAHLLAATRRYKGEIRRLEALEADRAARQRHHAYQRAAEIIEATAELVGDAIEDIGNGFVTELLRQGQEYRAGRMPTREGAGLPPCEHEQVQKPENPVPGLVLSCGGCGEKFMVTHVTGEKVSLAPIAGKEQHQCDLPNPEKTGALSIYRCPCGAQWRLYSAGPDGDPLLTPQWRRIDTPAHDCQVPNPDAYSAGEPWFCRCNQKWVLVAASVPAHDAGVVPSHWKKA